MEILDLVEGAFGTSGAIKRDIVDHAEYNAARPAVFDVLARLDDVRRYATVRDLWSDLADVPVE
ncbi:DUF2795 domain-containing protein [Pseudonocardia nigra]|uniref:DUF2795 domain-containing protein n=1 Tax=Pseudonocardia nigra TaxID=1921578 RepID=UPI001C5CF4A6|nr:DUF2795 domain-containing protein [Pseudonocardia nigra]